MLIAAALIALAAQDAAGWTQWMGPGRENRSPDTGLLKQWPSGGPPLLWKTDAVKDGFSAVAVAGGKVYTLGDLEDASYLVALNEADGKPAWKTRVGPARNHGKREWQGPRSTPTVDGDRVYILGEAGDLLCCDAATGKEVWRKHMKADFKGKVGGWLWSESPLVDGKHLVCIAGGEQGTVLALDKTTGAPVWRTSDLKDNAEYTSLLPAEIGGVRQYVVLTMNSVAGIGTDGKVLWRVDRKGETAICSTPVYHDGMVLVSSSYGNGRDTGIKVTAEGGRFKAEIAYDSKEIANHHGGLVRAGEHVYGMSGNSLVCIELKTGKVAWKDKCVGKGSITYADGHLICRSEGKRGEIALVDASPAGYKEKGRFALPDATGKNPWAYPVVAGGKLYIRNNDVLYAYDVKAK
jgi:outer membrane protein assembly factor BamB